MAIMPSRRDRVGMTDGRAIESAIAKALAADGAG